MEDPSSFSLIYAVLMDMFADTAEKPVFFENEIYKFINFLQKDLLRNFFRL